MMQVTSSFVFPIHIWGLAYPVSFLSVWYLPAARSAWNSQNLTLCGAIKHQGSTNPSEAGLNSSCVEFFHTEFYTG